MLIGIEDNKPEAAAAMRAAVAALGEDMRGRRGADALPGRRRQATDPRADRQGSPGQQALAPTIGVQCFNVGTAYTDPRAPSLTASR